MLENAPKALKGASYEYPLYRFIFALGRLLPSSNNAKLHHAAHTTFLYNAKMRNNDEARVISR